MYTCTCILWRELCIDILLEFYIVQKKLHTCICVVLVLSCSLFEEEISRMNPQAIVPPQPLQPAPTVGEYMYTVYIVYIFNNEVLTHVAALNIIL